MKTEEAKASEPVSNQELDEAVLIENEYNLDEKDSKNSSTDEVLFPGNNASSQDFPSQNIIVDKTIKRSYT